MASSSLSQESLDHDDFDLSNRRSRMKGTRSRAIPIYKNESVETTDDKDVDDEDYSGKAGSMQPLDEQSATLVSGSAGMEHISFSPGCMLFPSDHDSPTRAKVKDKRGWPGHLHKAKPAKDKRKLREKRRSSGLVHMQSTEVDTLTLHNVNESGSTDALEQRVHSPYSGNLGLYQISPVQVMSTLVGQIYYNSADLVGQVNSSRSGQL